MALLLTNAYFADAELPNPGRDSFIGTTAIIGSVLGATWELISGGDWEAVERRAVQGGLIGGGFGLITYLAILLRGVP